MTAKQKRRKGKNAAVTSVAVDKLDRGTLQTRARISPDPLLSPTLEPHRRQAGEAIREALEGGLGATGLDIVHIGMGGGASSGYHERLPYQRHIDLSMWLSAWRRTAAAKGIPTIFAEQFAEGHSIRQIVQHHVLSRHKVTALVNDGLDLYADLRGFRQRQHKHPQRISAWENDAFVPPETDQHIYIEHFVTPSGDLIDPWEWPSTEQDENAPFVYGERGGSSSGGMDSWSEAAIKNNWFLGCAKFTGILKKLALN